MTQQNYFSKKTVRGLLDALWMAVAGLSLAACGGGGGDGNVVNPTSSPSAIKVAALHQCPSAAMSPIDMSKMSCIVGQIDGFTTADPATAKPCSVLIDEKGNVTLTQGSVVRKHSLSDGVGSFNFVPPTLTAFSEYTGRKPSTVNDAGTPQSYEIFHFDSSTGTVDANGFPSDVGTKKNLQIQYLAPIDGAVGFPVFFVGSTYFGVEGAELLVGCHRPA